MSQYQLFCPIPDELGVRAVDVVTRLRNGQLKPAHSEEVANLICDLTDSVMRHFFQRPAENFKLGMASRGAIDLGIRSCVKTIRMAVKQILPRLPEESFGEIAGYIDEALQVPKATRKKA